MGRGASQIPSYPSAIPSEECDIGAYEFGVERLNDLVTFAPLPGTFQATTGAGAEGCPVTFEGGAFRFEARLKNKYHQSSAYASGGAGDRLLSNGNGPKLRNVPGHTAGGAGATMPVPTSEGYADGVFSPNEQIDVLLTIRLRDQDPFDMAHQIRTPN